MVGAKIIVIMGVAGSGKTTIGQLLSRKLRCPFFDADDFHPPGNIAKMASGIPLKNEDRRPWLESLRAKMKEEIAARRSAVFACSALKESYRDFLAAAGPGVVWIYLKGDAPLIAGRMAARSDHFMKKEMLASQFTELEEPKNCLTLDVSAHPEKIVGSILRELGSML